MVTCGVCNRPYKNDNSRAVHASVTHRGVPASVYAPDRVLKYKDPQKRPLRNEPAQYVAQSAGGKAGKSVTTATALPKGYVGAYWTTFSPSLGTVFHFYE